MQVFTRSVTMILTHEARVRGVDDRHAVVVVGGGSGLAPLWIAGAPVQRDERVTDEPKS